DPAEPAVQRREVHRAGGGGAVGGGGGTVGGVRRPGHGDRHPARAPGAHLRSVLAGRAVGLQARQRDGSRVERHAPPVPDAGGRGLRRERAGAGQHLHRARAAQRRGALGGRAGRGRDRSRLSGMAFDVAVVGAGPAGLAAGWALAAAGARVTLYERRRTPGGAVRTDELDGARVDPGVQLLGSYYRETFRLAAEVGASGLLVRSPGRDALWRGGRAHGLTYGSVASMAASGALPTGLKLRLAARYLPFLTRQSALDVNDPARTAVGLDDRESIAEWGRRALGDDFVELLAYSTLATYYTALPEETSAPFYHALARAGIDLTVPAVRG